MPKQLSRSIAQLSTLSILTVALIASGAQMASADLNSNNRTGVYPTEPKGDAIDSYTDHFFYAANPELNKRKLRSGDTAYIQEWQAIRETMVPLVKTNREACGRNLGSTDLYWEFDLDAPQNGSCLYSRMAGDPGDDGAPCEDQSRSLRAEPRQYRPVLGI
jgi:hypothetical protein